MAANPKEMELDEEAEDEDAAQVGLVAAIALHPTCVQLNPSHLIWAHNMHNASVCMCNV